jgi:acyl-ACP thioesterase
MIAPPAGGRVFHHPAAVGLADVTPSGRARLDAIARWLQDAAWADLLDTGIEDEGVWIVRRLELRVAAAPRFGEALEIATFCSGTGPLWAERRSTIRGEGDSVVEAAALWVHLSRDGLHPRPIPPDFAAVYGEAATRRRVRARLRHPPPPAGAPTRPWAFRAADLDMAGHVNNAAYWAAIEEELAGGELSPGWQALMEHRGPAAAGPAPVVADGGMRWVLGPGGDVLASAALGAPARSGQCSGRDLLPAVGAHARRDGDRERDDDHAQRHLGGDVPDVREQHLEADEHEDDREADVEVAEPVRGPGEQEVQRHEAEQ